MELSAKNVVIFGGFGGIGLALCKAFLKEKICALVILDLQTNDVVFGKLQKDYPSTKLISTSVDVTKKLNIERIFKQIVDTLKNIDIVVNAAGIVAEQDAELSVNVNLVGVINTSLTAFTYTDKTSGGRGGIIVNIASVLGLKPCPPYAIYAATKFGIIGFTRSLGCQFYYDKTGIKLITVCPGLTYTNMISNRSGNMIFPFAEEIVESSAGQSPESCAQNIMEAIKIGKNGSVWILRSSNLKEVIPVKYGDDMDQLSYFM